MDEHKRDRNENISSSSLAVILCRRIAFNYFPRHYRLIKLPFRPHMLDIHAEDKLVNLCPDRKDRKAAIRLPITSAMTFRIFLNILLSHHHSTAPSSYHTSAISALTRSNFPCKTAFLVVLYSRVIVSARKNNRVKKRTVEGPQPQTGF